jgi:hypothetical protein
MSEAQAVITEEVTQPTGGENETTPEVSLAAAPVETGAETGGAVVGPPASDRERSDFAKSFANLARQEKRFQGEKQEFQQVKKQASELENLRELAKSSPLEALESLGLSYDGLTRRVINDGNVPLEDKLAQQAQEIENLKEINRQNTLNRENREKSREQDRVRGDMIDKIRNLVENNDNYEMIKANDAYHTVIEVMEQQYAENGSILNFDEAADLVERYFGDQAERYYKSSKLRDRYKEHWQPTPPVAAQAEEPSPPSRPKGPRTLSNEMTSQTPVRSGELLSREDSLVRAAAILRGEV